MGGFVLFTIPLLFLNAYCSKVSFYMQILKYLKAPNCTASELKILKHVKC